MQWLIPAAGALALLFALYKAGWVNRQSQGNETMVQIGAAVREGAMAFLKREYRVLAVFVVVVAILLYFGNMSQGTSLVALSFVCTQLVHLAQRVGQAAAVEWRLRFVKCLDHLLDLVARLILVASKTHSPR